jgi:glycine cleavage system H protein
MENSMEHKIPHNLHYTKSHEWLREEGNDIYAVGITDHAQHLLGDLVFVEVPALDSHVNMGKECAVVESVKAASDVYSPISGKIIQVNEDLSDHPEYINQSPYDKGWIYKIKASDADEIKKLLSSKDYQQEISE